MSPIEFKLYEAMREEGLSPTPQFRIEGYIVDFAFPDVRLVVEAAAPHTTVGSDARATVRETGG